MKKVLVLNGSPRPNGNTRTLSEAFITRCIQRSYEVKRYNISDLNINACHACEKCFSNNKPCIIEDDFNEIAFEIDEADVIVFSVPVYFYSIPGKMKCFIDRLFCFEQANIDLTNKKFAIISCCEAKEMNTFDGVRIPIEKTARIFGWELVDEILAPGIKEIGDIDNTDGIRRVKDLADKI